MTWGEPVPSRQPGEALRHLDFTTADNRDMAAVFRHRDARIWMARAASRPVDAEHTIFPDFAYVLSLTSAGCRSYQFICRNLDGGTHTALRFANMQLPSYSRLVADARGSTEHPRSDDIGVFSIQVVKRQQVSAASRNSHTARQPETHRYTVNGIGRIDDGAITMFPTTAELELLLDPVCASGVRAIVPAGVNVIPTTLTMRQELLAEAVAETFDTDVVTAAVFSRFNDDAHAALQGLHDGSYTMSRPRQREDRVIDIFGDGDAD